MWALRRASVPLRSRGFGMGTARAACIRLIPNMVMEDEAGIIESSQRTYDRFLPSKAFYHSEHASLKFMVLSRELSSQADAKSMKEDLEDGFSELETPAEERDELMSESELSDDNEDVEEPETEIDPTEEKSPGRRAQSELFKAIMNAPGLSVHTALDKWVEDGKEITRSEVVMTMIHLRRRQMHGRALQLSEWLEAKKQLDFGEKDYAYRLDLIAKARGLQKAESYLESVPKSFVGEKIYQTLLANFVSQNNVKKAEEMFNKMKDLGFPVTTFACNSLLLLYKRNDRTKIADVLLLMENENVKANLFTYKILIDSKGESKDVAGMDQIVETMKAEGIEPDLYIKGTLAKHYASAGLKEKAEAVLKEMEGENLKQNRWICKFLLPIYAELEKADEVRRLWKFCKSNPHIEECLAAIEAWGKLKEIEEAEAVFEKMSNKWQKLSSKHYSVLLKVYANHKKLQKGKDLVKQMAASGCRIGPLTWDALVKLYIESGEVEKADSVLQKASQQNQMKPLFSTFMAILDQYAKRGDIHNSEKIFHRMRQAGYTSRLRQFQVLIQAYDNAKVPAYGIRERMKADDVFPNRYVSNLLVRLDPFGKTAVSELLD